MLATNCEIHELCALPEPLMPAVYAIGVFDGVHIGHKELIRRMAEYAQDNSFVPGVFTYSNSPREMLSPETFPGYITDFSEKLRLLEEAGAKRIVYRTFDRDFASKSAEYFIQEVLLKKLAAKAVFVGFNFRFGSGRTKGAEYLSEALKIAGCECFIMEPYEYREMQISSTLIRRKIHRGDFPCVEFMLGRKISFEGKVISGNRIARRLGYPTANISVEDSHLVLPANGVYSAVAEVAGKKYASAANLGMRPTFNGKVKLLEVHLFDFSGDLYGKVIKVRFINKIRDEVKFPSEEALKEQLFQDEENIRQMLATPLLPHCQG
ncbi:MAG: bifunctional riboflavin kinase/FAD synthetase [Candidatus Riflebacteria bacterium]|nr:bifunctional riboflavin kinase/FAD synthetase [Candidatus Riflebacteria bacterium]